MKKVFLILSALFLIVSCGDDPESEVSAALGELNGECYPNKTCNEGLDCSDENICIKTGDLPDADGDNDTSDTSDTSSDDDSSDTSDSSNDGDTTDSPDSENENNQAECGNGTKEEGETCEKGDYVKCSEIDAQYSDLNFALCNDYCNGWNTDKCETSQQNIPPRGTFPAVTFEVKYLYNGQDEFNKGENQGDEQYQTGLFETSIPLSDGSAFAIPHPQANVHWISAYYINTALIFNQTSYYCVEGSGCSATSPMVEFFADLSALSAGKELSVGIADENQVNLLVEDNANDCVLLVGYGTLKVNSVTIAPGSAGKFGFTTSEIGLYNVTITPEGDVTEYLEKEGFTICTE